MYKSNKTWVFGRFYVCILKKWTGECSWNYMVRLLDITLSYSFNRINPWFFTMNKSNRSNRQDLLALATLLSFLKNFLTDRRHSGVLRRRILLRLLSRWSRGHDHVGYLRAHAQGPLPDAWRHARLLGWRQSARSAALHGPNGVCRTCDVTHQWRY